MRPDGNGESGIVLVGEALWTDEVRVGLPFQGSAGHILNNALTRAGIDRSKLTILNSLWCKPPEMQMFGKPYFLPAISHCKFNHLDPAIKAAKPKVIVVMGAVPYLSVVETHGGILEARGYPIWSDRYKAWIVPTVHPSFIQRGNWNYEAILIHDLQRAVEISLVGYTPKWGTYLLDPTASEALAWAREAILSEYPISADIETPRKGEDEEAASLDDESYHITRISFSSSPFTGMSVPWRSEYMAAIRLLLESENDKIFWNGAYDIPRILFNGVLINGTIHDGMVAWHVLNTDLPKRLGTVATFLTPTQPRWKHLSSAQPAFYNAVDSDVALRCTLAAFDELKKVGLWRVYERHVLRFDKITSKMSRAGMPLDVGRRMEYATRLKEERVKLDERLAEVTPFEIRPKFVYKNPPRDKEGLVELPTKQEISVCPNCGYERPPKTHFAKATKKFPDRKCHGFQPEIRQVPQLARLEPIKVSSKFILAYQKIRKHPIQFHGKGEDRKPTANENAIRTTLLKYPDDPLYPVVLKISKIRTLQGRYIGKLETQEDGTEKLVGGLMVGADGRVHTVFSHNPSTLRMASENPNMQNLPRAADEYTRLVKDMFVAEEGKVFIARDYAGIESLLVGYHSGSQRYTRISFIDIHSFITAWALYELERKLPFSDVPQFEWSDADLRDSLALIKKNFKPNRQGVKHMGHAANYMAGSKKAQEVLFDELGIMVPLKEIKKFMAFYKELFPEIPKWHSNLALQVDGTRSKEAIVGAVTGAGYIRNPYGYLQRFYEVIRWEKIHGKWEWKFGEPAKALIASLPQSGAAGIIKEAAIRFDDNHPELSEGLRLFVHDEILGEWNSLQTEEVLYKLKVEMEKPNVEYPLDPAWGMGEYLHVPTEGKVGRVWGEMVEVQD